MSEALREMRPSVEKTEVLRTRRSGAAFDIVLFSMAQKPQGKWIAILGLVLALISCLVSGLNSYTSYSNRRDNIAAVDQSKQEKQTESILTKLLEPTNGLIREMQRQVDGINGRVERLDKDVTLLLEHQLKAAAVLPASTFAAQIPDVKFLYELADKKNIPVPIDVTNQIRLKLASIDSTTTDYWALSSDVITRVSRAAYRGMVTIKMEHQSAMRNYHLVLDQAAFVDSRCDRCVIEYNGGENDFSGSQFNDCLFIIHVSAAPAPAGVRFIRTLLAATDFKSITAT